MRWPEAHRLAMVAAAQARADLGVDRSTRVDVYEALWNARTILMIRGMPKLFGAYLHQPGTFPGIIVNANLDEATRRHTAAHELGHHILGHASRVDPDVDPLPSTSAGGQSPEERSADAFAYWFLMPRQAVLAELNRMRQNPPDDPLHVYQLSLFLGVHYRALVRHLRNLSLISQGRFRAWLKVEPGSLKSQLDRGYPLPANRRRDVWALDERSCGRTLHVQLHDRLVITLTEPFDGGRPWALTSTFAHHLVGDDHQPGGHPPEVSGLRPRRTFVVDIGDLPPGHDATLTASRRLDDEEKVWTVTLRSAPCSDGIDSRWLG